MMKSCFLYLIIVNSFCLITEKNALDPARGIWRPKEAPRMWNIGITMETQIYVYG